MKNIKLISLTGVLLFFGCNKLDQQPYSLLTQSGLSTESDASSLVSAIYSSLIYDAGDQAIYGRNINFLVDMTTDDWAAGPAAINANVQALSKDLHDAGNDRILAIWRQHYVGIARANTAVDLIEGFNIADDKRTQYVNEAKFIRALLYFNLVRLFGGVPLVLHQPASIDLDDLKQPRATLDEVYTQIIDDLTSAENLKPINAGRATSGAAKSLLAKVYLTRRDWPNAAQKALEVINNKAVYGYDLFANFADNFNYAFKFTKEIIFGSDFSYNSALTNYNYLFACSWPGASGNRADVPADGSLYNLYQDGDTRRARTFYTHKVAAGVSYDYPAPGYFNKYVNDTYVAAGITAYVAPISFPVLRYADVLLIAAEALNEKNHGPTAEAFGFINQVRRRAFGKDPSTADPVIDLPASIGYSDFQDAVWLERRLELALEGNRWFDLVREIRDGHSLLVSAVSKVPAKAAVSEKNNLFPIPQSQIDINKSLEQNELWK
ncbi:Starch-binding associating with outer membrane [bacterium A37T11]|nr:Starch-binding associating with outer membrane [bacterium A37T11]